MLLKMGVKICPSFWCQMALSRVLAHGLSGVGLVCAVNLDLGFLNKKIRDKVVHSCRCNSRVKETV